MKDVLSKRQYSIVGVGVETLTAPASEVSSYLLLLYVVACVEPHALYALYRAVCVRVRLKR